MRITGCLTLFVASTSVLAVPAAAQFGRGPGMRAPVVRGLLTPTVGTGAVYQTAKGQVEISLVGIENVRGKQGYWVQIGVASPEGQVYIKQLRVMDGNTTTIVRVIMQPPQGGAMEMPASMFGPTTSADAHSGKLLGRESITTAAGTFNCDHYQGEDGSWDSWVAANVPPFGVVKSRDSTGEMTLVRSLTGVVDHVTGTPASLDMPQGFSPGMVPR
jgi:hypothetical protein